VSGKRRRRNLVQLDRSVGRFMTRSERLRFLRVYLSAATSLGRASVPAPMRWDARWDRRAVRKLVERLMLERERKEREFARRRIRRGRAGGWDPADTQSPEAIASELSQRM
jgi:hypothetical protein